MWDEKKRTEAKLISGTLYLNEIHITSACVLGDVLFLSDVATTMRFYEYVEYHYISNPKKYFNDFCMSKYNT